MRRQNAEDVCGLMLLDVDDQQVVRRRRLGCALGDDELRLRVVGRNLEEMGLKLEAVPEHDIVTATREIPRRRFEIGALQVLDEHGIEPAIFHRRYAKVTGLPEPGVVHGMIGQKGRLGFLGGGRVAREG